MVPERIACLRTSTININIIVTVVELSCFQPLYSTNHIQEKIPSYSQATAHRDVASHLLQRCCTLSNNRIRYSLARIQGRNEGRTQETTAKLPYKITLRAVNFKFSASPGARYHRTPRYFVNHDTFALKPETCSATSDRISCTSILLNDHPLLRVLVATTRCGPV